MDTKPLESFAKTARRELIVAVEARVSTVLAAGSVARSERAETVRLLESEIADHGREHVIDKVAYTWFNRLIALRFMDARGYTDAGVVSPAPGQAHGQPEILADAKRGDVDTEVVTNASAHEAIIGLLDGTRRSTDAESEAYALLLTEYCRHWHKTMPFMFEAEGAYTELLVPAGLLADGALLSRVREVLTEDVCDDVEVIGWLYQFYISERKAEVFAGFKKNKKAGADEIPAATQLFTPHWIVRYLLENSLGRLWMLNRPSSRLVDQMDYYIAPVEEESDFLKVAGPEELTVIDPACGSGHMLTYAFDLLYAIYEEAGYAPSEIPSLILTHNLYGTEIDPRAGVLAAFALTMKARAKDRRFFTRVRAQPKICVIESISFTPDELDLLITKSGNRDAEMTFWSQFRNADTLGSLIQPDADETKQAAAVLDRLKDQEETLYYDTLIRARKAVAQAGVLSSNYSIATANPPYMGTKNMDANLAEFVKDWYPNSKSDLYAIFLDRSLRIIRPGGMLAMITMQGWAFLSSYEKLRCAVLSTASLEIFAHLGTNAFDSIGGAVVSTAAFVLKAGGIQSQESIFLRLTEGRSEAEKDRALRACIDRTSQECTFTISLADLSAIPGRPLAYWVADAALNAIRNFPQLSEAAKPRQGLATSDNNRFLRYWWEPGFASLGLDLESRDAAKESRKRWFPCQKGGPYRKWYGNHTIVIDWQHDGAAMLELATTLYRSPTRTIKNMQFYFREGGTWSTISANSFAMRYSPPGFISETKGAICFTEDPATLQTVIAYANSTVADYFLGISSPTLDFHEGPVGRLPFDPTPDTAALQRSSRCIEIAREDWNSQEESWEFEVSPVIGEQGRDTNKLRDSIGHLRSRQRAMVEELRSLEEENNVYFADVYGLGQTLKTSVAPEEVTLTGNRDFRFSSVRAETAREAEMLSSIGEELISYAVGCIFGRYSLDAPGLVLADQGATLQDYLMKVVSTSSPSQEALSTDDITFMPDSDNVIPLVDDGWFEDDVVERFREFLKAAFGTEHFEENLRFVEESLGVKTLRDYFITKSGRSKFYDDHVKRYKKRPIYWMFSSPKGSFNALIYLHRYTPSTVSTVLNEYLREYENKLQKAFERAETAAAVGASTKDQKEADRLRKVLAELRDYEHDVLYPLATQQLEIDLDDGVKVNYPKFYPAVKKIVGLESSDG
ncbi:BREX-1 system adenine-specific DNA-methyltransferase PglX [Rhodococcus sp. YH3-3]|uniref:BREX-1 system adenine-specific DNA-methyltransferase PglX n=1 Tax=Rhodococcus sp. YH3-3 TaxID=1803579 RepID=UPI0007DB5EF3|nr:BREX-1 system adenine-specific DNA-methyltransferase PglX [Rhodococcus sp. YH3-3]